DSYRVMGANQLLKAMLTPGEYTEYVQEVLDINGFDNSFEDKVEEAKN
ncbi:TPA: phage portal protein, partial [Clostridioides difficile]|nr:phage portal protein [Clostridioides difficile]HBG5851892.1 phage portal protein [Clostridioides difficile]